MVDGGGGGGDALAHSKTVCDTLVLGWFINSMICSILPVGYCEESTPFHERQYSVIRMIIRLDVYKNIMKGAECALENNF